MVCPLGWGFGSLAVVVAVVLAAVAAMVVAVVVAMVRSRWPQLLLACGSCGRGHGRGRDPVGPSSVVVAVVVAMVVAAASVVAVVVALVLSWQLWSWQLWSVAALLLFLPHPRHDPLFHVLLVPPPVPRPVCWQPWPCPNAAIPNL